MKWLLFVVIILFSSTCCPNMATCGTTRKTSDEVKFAVPDGWQRLPKDFNVQGLMTIDRRGGIICIVQESNQPNLQLLKGICEKSFPETMSEYKQEMSAIRFDPDIGEYLYMIYTETTPKGRRTRSVMYIFSYKECRYSVNLKVHKDIENALDKDLDTVVRSIRISN